ncbi:hypothetical protein JCM11641_002032 [Rhodosporidiobolus odoratus]
MLLPELVTYDDPAEFDEIDIGTDGEGGGPSGGTEAKKNKGKARKEVCETDSSEDDDEPTPPKTKKNKMAAAPKKKARGKGGKAAKDHGKLESLKTLPVELLVEIFSHLDPQDLLAINTVSKTYHALLSSTSSTSIWKRARERFDLPEATVGNFTEMQYAQLMFGTRCQHCGSKAKFADFFIRQRICTECRREKFVKLNWLYKSHPGLHPATKHCILPSYHSPAATRWTVAKPYGFTAELERYSALLWKLQYEEDDAEEGDSGDDTDSDLSDLTPCPPSSPFPEGRNRRYHSSRRVSYAEESDSEDEMGSSTVLKPSRKVEAFVALRQKLIDAIHEEARTLRLCHFRVYKQVEEAAWEAKRIPSQTRTAMWRRADALEEKVLGLGLGYTKADFSGGWYTNKLVMDPEPLTNEIWDDIQPKILKLLTRLTRTKVKKEEVSALQTRQKDLRHRYDKLQKSLSETARPFLPLFVDFLLLPSVKELWLGGAAVNDQRWYESLDAVIEDIEEYRLELVLHARGVILAAARDVSDEGMSDLDDSPDVSDEFFDRATSLVACSFKDCIYSHMIHDSSIPRGIYGRRRWVSDPHSVGTLVAVLKHQHILNNFNDNLSTTLTKKVAGASTSASTSSDPTLQPQYRIHLPAAIASAVLAFLDLAGADPATAGKEEIEEANRNGQWEWENSTTHQRFARHDGWEVLLRLIKRACDKLSKVKPPKTLDPPIIVQHPPTTRLTSYFDEKGKSREEDRSEHDGRVHVEGLTSDEEEEGEGQEVRERVKLESNEEDGEEEDMDEASEVEEREGERFAIRYDEEEEESDDA